MLSCVITIHDVAYWRMLVTMIGIRRKTIHSFIAEFKCLTFKNIIHLLVGLLMVKNGLGVFGGVVVVVNHRFMSLFGTKWSFE